MDRQIKAEKAWKIPYEIFNKYRAFEIDQLVDIELGNLTEFFNKKKLHRFNDKMAEIFYLGIRDIKNKYDGNASRIWSGKPSSSAVVYKFLEFKGNDVWFSRICCCICFCRSWYEDIVLAIDWQPEYLTILNFCTPSFF